MRLSRKFGVGLAAFALGVPLGDAAQAATKAPPLALSVRWTGQACNPTGSMTVTLKNTSRRPIAAPKDAIIGVMLVAEIYFPTEVAASVGHPFVYQIYRDHYARQGGLRRLRPGATIDYPVLLLDGDPDSEPNGEFGKYYDRMLKKGGRVTVRYILEPDPDTFGVGSGVYYVNADWKPYVHSNMLTCPGADRQ